MQWIEKKSLLKSGKSFETIYLGFIFISQKGGILTGVCRLLYPVYTKYEETFLKLYNQELLFIHR